MAEYTDFGIEVKTKLLEPPAKTQAWLAAKVSEKTGLYVDGSYISRILTGKRSAPKIKNAISEILDIKNLA